MEKSYKITIDDGAYVPTEEDLKTFAKSIGVTYEEYVKALDNGFYRTADVLDFVKKMRNE